MYEVSVKITCDEMAKLLQLCKERGVSRSRLIREALNLYFQETNKWIPCESMLPEDYEFVDLTVSNTFFGDKPLVKIGYYESENDLWHVNFMTVPNNGTYVYAWKKRSEPYIFEEDKENV